MKITDLVAGKLVALGVEKPSARLVEEIAKAIEKPVQKLVDSLITPRLAARAFAATLANAKGVSGDAKQVP